MKCISVFTFVHQRGGMGWQTIHLGIFKLAVLLSLQHSSFNRVILKFLMRKSFHVLRHNRSPPSSEE